jgi:hypothetical protein
MKRGWNARAQVSVFIIFAIIIVGSIILAIFITNSSKQKDKYTLSNSDLKPQFDLLKQSVRDCAISNADDAIFMIGLQGGYYKKPKEFYNFSFFFVPYYFKNNKATIPTNEMIEKELGNYVDENIKDCINNMEKSDFIINVNSIKTKANISKESVLFNVNMPVLIEKDSDNLQFNTIANPIILPSRLGDMIEVAQFIGEEHEKDSTKLCMSCIYAMLLERNLTMQKVDFTKTTSSFTLMHGESGNREDFDFMIDYS